MWELVKGFLFVCYDAVMSGWKVPRMARCKERSIVWPEGRGRVFLRNDGKPLPNCMVSWSENIIRIIANCVYFLMRITLNIYIVWIICHVTCLPYLSFVGCVGQLCGAVVLGSCVGQLYGAILPVGLETLGYNSTLGCRWTNISYEWILDNQNFMAWQP